MRIEKMLVLTILVMITVFDSAASAAINPPTNVISSLSGTSLTVSWTAATGAIQYRVHIYVNAETTPAVTQYVNGTSTIVTVPSATNCYIAHVRTWLPNQSTNSAVSNKVCGTASDIIPPSSITGLKNVSYAKNYISWTWSDPSDSDFSKVMVYIDGIFEINITKGIRSYNTTTNFANLTPGTTYKISTRTVDTTGNINATWINDTETTAPDTIPVPIPPGPLVASLINIALTVSANGGTPPYTYNWTGIPTLPTPCSGIDTNTIICNPTIPGTYDMTVTITDAKRNAVTVSNNVTTYDSIRVDSSPVPVLTQAITDLNNITYAQDYINWTWLNPTDPGFGHVEIYVDNESIINVSDDQFYNKTGLIPNTEHIIHVRTVDINGNVNLTWVNKTSITARDSIPPNGISNLYNTSYAPNYINWRWTDPSNIDFDHVDVYINGVFNDSVTKGIQTYTVIGLNPDTIYEIGTRTIDTSGNINDTWINDTRRTANVSGNVPGNTIRFITIGDPHLGEVPDGTPNLTAAANFLKNRTNSFDLVVVVGDYHNITSAQNILGKIGKPYYLVKGNHDGLTSCSSSSFGDNVSNVGGYQLILVGICGSNPGQSILTKSYDKTIPTIVFTHLPSACLSSWGSYYKTGCGFVDTLGIDIDKLLSVYSGHVHEYSNQIINNTLYVTEDNLGGNGPASDYIGYTAIQNRTVNYNRLYYR